MKNSKKVMITTLTGITFLASTIDPIDDMFEKIIAKADFAVIQETETPTESAAPTDSQPPTDSTPALIDESIGLISPSLDEQINEPVAPTQEDETIPLEAILGTEAGADEGSTSGVGTATGEDTMSGQEPVPGEVHGPEEELLPGDEPAPEVVPTPGQEQPAPEEQTTPDPAPEPITEPIPELSQGSSSQAPEPFFQDTTPPMMPARFEVQPIVEPYLISLYWSMVEEAYGYRIYRNNQQVGEIFGATPLLGNDIFYSDTLAEPNQTYLYSLTAYDGAGNESNPITLTVESMDTIPPSTPAKVVGKAITVNQIQLIWSHSTDNRKLAGYRIYYRDLNESDGQFWLIGNADSSENYFIHDGFGPNLTLEYKVSAVDATGNESPFSETIQIKTHDNWETYQTERLPFTLSLED